MIALQCRTRERTAKRFLSGLLKEQKDVGKLKENNDRLKEEMASLRAMLAAQAKEDRASSAHEVALAEKQKQIDELEKKIAELERELSSAKGMVEKLEATAQSQQMEMARDKEQIKKLQTTRPQQIATRNKSGGEESNTRRKKSNEGLPTVVSGSVPAGSVSPEVLAEHRSKVAKLEEELEMERRIRKVADGEIIKLRAKVNGVDLTDAELRELLAQESSPSGLVSEESSFAGDDASIKARYVHFPRFGRKDINFVALLQVHVRCVCSAVASSTMYCCGVSSSSVFVAVFEAGREVGVRRPRK